jgi:hypothetical protein
MSLFKRSGMWRDVNPTGAIGDLITVFHQAGRNRWRIAGLALLPPLGILWMFANEEYRGNPPGPVVTYITTFRPGRSDAEIVASNLANQRYKEQAAVEQAKREEDVRQMYVKIGRLSGMDVDAIERRAKADREAEAARTAAVPSAVSKAAGSQPATGAGK